MEMKLSWLTDTHLNFLDQKERFELYKKLLENNNNGIVITGDIAESDSICSILSEMNDLIKKPIYFVLGNHDYYGSSISIVRKKIEAFCKHNARLNWMTGAKGVLLQADTVLVGTDGWADGRYGDYKNSQVTLNDCRLIGELFQSKIISRFHLLETMKELADDDANTLNSCIQKAVEEWSPKKIIVLTHVPPFKECSLFRDKISDDDHLPFFSSKATGDILKDSSDRYRGVEFTVLCGHTHHAAEVQVAQNLNIKVGFSEYGRVGINEIIL